MKSVDWTNFMTNSCPRPTIKEKTHWKISISIWYDRLKSSKRTVMNFTGNGSRSRLSWFMKTISFKILRILFKTCKTRRQSWNRKSPDWMITIVRLKRRSKKSKLTSKDFNRKWTSSMTLSRLTVTKSPNSKMKISTWSLNSSKNLRKWKDKPSSSRSTLTKSVNKRLN